MLAVYKKEIRGYFATPTAYIVLGLYWLALALLLWVIPGQYNIIDSGYAQLDGLFAVSPWLFLLLCPAICMRTVAEERQRHTWDLLLTKPIPVWSIVLEKYLAAWTLTLIALLPNLLHFVFVAQLAEPIGNVDSGAFIGASLGLLFLTAANCAIGLFTSTLTKSQILAFILGFTLCFLLLYGFDLCASLFTNGRVVHAWQQIGFNAHYQSISRGVVDSRDLVYFVVTTALFLLLSIRIAARQR